jgi:signal transduction histidine kinase
MPKSLAGRLALTLAVTALAVLIATGGALFVVLRGLHRDAAFGRLHAVGTTLLAQLGTRAAQGSAQDALDSLRQQVGDLGFVVLFVAGDRDPVLLAGNARPVEPVPPLPTGGRGTFTDATLRFDDGGTWAVSVVAATAPAAVVPRGFVLAAPDRAGAATVEDLARTIPLVALVVLVVGGPLAWVLARSTTGPLRRLAAATASIPGAGHGADAPPLPEEGPSEVRELTGRFNAMTGELVRTRRAETELLANLRHDLRTPLTVIGGFAEALVDGTAQGEAAARAAGAIRDETARLGGLVDELGAIAGGGEGGASLRPEELRPADLLGAVVTRFAARAQSSGIALETETEPDAPAFAADRLAVDRILGNLIENALRAQIGPGRVLVAARAATLPDGRGAVALVVSDDGPGFPPGAVARVFERSYRADPARSGPGSGLGLAIVRELARAHGGDATAENLAPRGARVSVVLPMVPATLAE